MEWVRSSHPSSLHVILSCSTVFTMSICACVIMGRRECEGAPDLALFVCCNTLQRHGSKLGFIVEQVQLGFEALANVSWSLGPLWLCVQNITEAAVVGEVETAAAIEVWEEWRLRIRMFKHSCTVWALIWLHLGTGCSEQWWFPRVQKRCYQWREQLVSEFLKKWQSCSYFGIYSIVICVMKFKHSHFCVHYGGLAVGVILYWIASTS